LLIVAHAIQFGKNHRQAGLSQHNRNIRIWIGNLAVFASKHWLTVREKLGQEDSLPTSTRRGSFQLFQ